MHSRQRARTFGAEFLSFCFLARVGLRKIGGHRLEVEAVFRIVGSLEVLVLELVEQESHAFEAVAPVAVAGMGQESDHSLVKLNAPRCLWTVSSDGTLGALS